MAACASATDRNNNEQRHTHTERSLTDVVAGVEGLGLHPLRVVKSRDRVQTSDLLADLVVPRTYTLHLDPSRYDEIKGPSVHASLLSVPGPDRIGGTRV